MPQNSHFPTRWLSLSGSELRVIGLVALVVLGSSAATYVVRNYWWQGGMTVKGQQGALPKPKRLNINTAQKYELQLLPGVGPKTAQAILEYRRASGYFSDLDGLKKVKGIGPHTVRDIRPRAMCVVPEDDRKERQ